MGITPRVVANNKNQHYVPKTYLKPFGDEGERSINLSAFGPNRCVEGASIRKQCSKNYFYGKEPIYEQFIQFVEGRYGQAIRRLRKSELNESDVGVFFSFFVLQYLRTPHQLAQREQLFETVRNTVIGGRRLGDVHEDAMQPFDTQREMQQQIYIAAKASETLNDLRPVLLINRTKTPFIASDNPACITNRLYTQRYQDETSGMIQSGGAIFLPITPRLAFMGYDADVFQTFANGIEHHVWNEQDVRRINELQAQVATQSLYFSEWKDREYVERLARGSVPYRRDNWTFIWTSIQDGDDGEFERYRTVTEADDESTEPRITTISTYNPAPSTWPTFLKFKLRPRGFATGSAMGFVRRAHAVNGKGERHREVVLPQTIPANERPQNRDIMYVLKDRSRRPSKPRKA